jgi:Fic family protein
LNPDWDADSPRLRANLEKVLGDIVARSTTRPLPSLSMAKAWHRAVMTGLAVPQRAYVGKFRGKGALRYVMVRITDAKDGRVYYGTPPEMVEGALQGFIGKLAAAASHLDSAIPVDATLSDDAIAAVLDLAAFAHAEWVRIHPFANGNGRIARIWANFILIRYGLPPVVALRPRPNGDYADASAAAMSGDSAPMAAVFRTLLERALYGKP